MTCLLQVKLNLLNVYLDDEISFGRFGIFTRFAGQCAGDQFVSVTVFIKFSGKMTTKRRLMALHLSLLRSTSADFCLALTANCCVRSRSARTSTWRFSVWWFSSSQRSRITWWEGWGKWPTHYLQNVLTITINHSLDKIVQKSTKVVQSFTLSCTCAGFPNTKGPICPGIRKFLQKTAKLFVRLVRKVFIVRKRRKLLVQPHQSSQWSFKFNSSLSNIQMRIQVASQNV